MKTVQKIQLTLFVFFAGFFVFGIGIDKVFAAPASNPPSGGVFQADPTAPQGSLIINNIGAISVGNWQGTTISVSKGGTGSTQTGDTACPGASCVTGIRTNLGVAASGANSDITSLSPTGNLILTPTGNVGIGTTSPNDKLEVNGNIRTSAVIGTNTGNTKLVLQSVNSGGNVEIQNSNNLYIQGGVLQVAGSGNSYFTGNVGIGTTSPTSILHLAGQANPDLRIQTNSASGLPQLTFRDSSGTQLGSMHYIVSSNTMRINNNVAAGDIRFAPQNADRVVIDKDGNVGIGTTNPQQGLHLAKTGGITLRIQDTSTYNAYTEFYGGSTPTRYGYVGLPGAGSPVMTLASANGADITFASNSGELMRILSGGNVGIGTTAPGQKLEVNGNIKLTGNALVAESANSNGIELDLNNLDVGAHKWALVSWGSAAGGGGRNGKFSIFDNTSGGDRLLIDTSGNVGIGTTTPTTARLVVTPNVNNSIDAGGGYIQNLATPPINNNDAATKKYIDDLFTGGGVSNSKACSAAATCAMNGATLNGGNITGVGKITAGTFDPLYEINSNKYATYVAESLGINVEMFGKGKLVKSPVGYAYAIDFAHAPEGGNLWVFWQTINEGKDMGNIMLNITPEGARANLWYEIKPDAKQIVVRGDKEAAFSYTMVAPRFDSSKWETKTNTLEQGAILKVKK